MAEENKSKDQKMEEKEEKQNMKKETEEKKVEDTVKSKEDKKENKKEDAKEKKNDKKDNKESEKPKVPKKSEAVVNGRDLRISTKHAVAVCDFIRNKNVDIAISGLEEVEKLKKAIPMKGEIPHRKGKIMSGRYPINAVKAFLRLLKSVRANAINHDMELEKVKIYCMANIANRPFKRFGQGRHKRSHVQIKLIPVGGKK